MERSRPNSLCRALIKYPGATRTLAAVQRWTGFGFAAFGAALAFEFVDSWWALIGVAPLAVAVVLAFAGGRLSIPRQLLLAPAAATVSLLLVFLVLSFRFAVRYDAGYNIARALQGRPGLPVYVLRQAGLANSLGFHSANPTRCVEETPEAFPFYAVVESGSATPWTGDDVQRIGTFRHVPPDSIAKALLSPEFLLRSGTRNVLVRVDGPPLSGGPRAR